MMMSVKAIRALKLMMPIVAVISLMTQFIAILTNDWLHTVESIPNTNYQKFGMPLEMEFLKKYTVSGLWSLCYNDPPDLKIQCIKIDYFSQEEYIPDQNDSTMAIPYAVKKAAIYVLISTALLVLGQLIYFVSQICRWKRIYIFISGIPFILAGLLILTGIVVYISTFKNEVGYKLRIISEFQDALFTYSYGYSFLFLVASLLLCELSGTLSIFLYVSQKHFKIMIDIERNEVLKHNIINILKNRHKQTNNGQNMDSLIMDGLNPNDSHNHPTLQITYEDFDAVLPTTESPSNINDEMIINHGLLNADYGIDSAFYQCGRHGSRGRRNSRGNDSYLGSPRESTDYSFKMIKNTEQKTESPLSPTIDMTKLLNRNEQSMVGNTINDSNITKTTSTNNNNNSNELQELCIGNLISMSNSNTNNTNIKHKKIIPTSSNKSLLLYPIIFDKQSITNNNNNDNYNGQQQYCDTNKSTFV